MTFLPLLDTFNPNTTQDWWQLAQCIQDWLINIPHDSQQWTWGCDVFWLAFVGAHPMFPLGRWSFWDMRIPLEGPYIEDLVQSSVTGGRTNQDKTTLLEQTWLEFCSHVSLFYPFPLIVDMQ
ncbi:hypothetical protein SCLCIDRAFT_124746 [Scleroderma citrinum Foug A]|uniref:Uncharacterized protein n=1 Tax=Scleroderma citrinum Foug A TaxID=1036808 RepID=A0A0C3DHN6_9AGAM|nr:hypothetical protein SCLCIDRAFT_124746 [Scleroderma citrinum Foug A]